jgi:hypothetical protein
MIEHIERGDDIREKKMSSHTVTGSRLVPEVGQHDIVKERIPDRRVWRSPTLAADRNRLSSIELRRLCSVDQFEFTTTEELPYIRDIIGQPRGVRAIEFGIKIDSSGYNIFLLGPTGSGRATAVRRFLERHAKEGRTPHDWAYVYNFKAPHKPRALMLPPGTGETLRDAMEGLVADLRRQIPLVLNTEDFRQGIEEIDRDLDRRREAIMGKVLSVAAEKQLSIVRASTGLAVVPMSNGQPIAPELFAQMPEEERRVIEERRLMVHVESLKNDV